MAWNSKYWDILDQLYWWPKYMGFASIPQRKWSKQGDLVCVPAELVNPTGPLYARALRADDLKAYLLAQEEILNHLFDLTFAIAGDEVLSRLFCAPLGIDDGGPFESIGRETYERYGWGRYENVTQQDGFFVGPSSLIGVELKLGSDPWPEQIVKYAALMVWEERVTGPKDQLGLLYIVPEASVATHWRKCGLQGPRVDGSIIELCRERKLSSRIRKMLADDRDTLILLLERLRLSVTTWTAFRSVLKSIEKQLDASRVGDQTLFRLVSGFRAQLETHGGTGIEP